MTNLDAYASTREKNNIKSEKCPVSTRENVMYYPVSHKAWWGRVKSVMTFAVTWCHRNHGVGGRARGGSNEEGKGERFGHILNSMLAIEAHFLTSARLVLARLSCRPLLVDAGEGLGSRFYWIHLVICWRERKSKIGAGR